MEFLKKIQRLPEERKKIILWAVVGVIAIVLFFWWFKGFQAKMETLKSQGYKAIKNISLREEFKSFTDFSR